MGRQVKIRASFVNDANYLMRMVTAVEGDPKRSVKWKSQVIQHLNSSIALMLEDTQANLKLARRAA
jgi:hypothetical protein